jgi:hypothetical protein
MPYIASSYFLKKVLSDVLKDDEIKEAIARVALSRDWVGSQLSKSLETDDKIRLGTASLKSEYDLIERQLAERQSPSLSYLAIISKRILWVTLIVVIFFILVWVTAYFGLDFSANLLQISVRLVTKPPYQYVLAFAVVIVAILFSRVCWEYRKIKMHQLADLPARNSLEAELNCKRHEIEDKVIPDLVRQEVRALIDCHSNPSYELQLTVSNAPGLAEVYNPAYDISTSAVEKLRFMLRTMPGGSIGIAGPRGAGKSTLLRTFCHEAVTELDGRQAFTVLTSAPVEYEHETSSFIYSE